MIESKESDPSATVDAALAKLSDVATSSAIELNGLNEEIAAIRDHRMRGWSWRRIISHAEAPDPLSLLTKIAANISRASGTFRRALALGLRDEGMQVTEIAKHFEVSRQRVSALLRRRGAESDEAEDAEDPIAPIDPMTSEP